MSNSGLVARGGAVEELKERLVKFGLSNLTVQEAIELVLSFTCPDIAEQQRKKCAEKFTSLRHFFTTFQQELVKGGFSPDCLAGIMLFRELPAEVLRENIVEKPYYKSSKEIFDYLFYSMRDLDSEVFKVLYLNSRNQIIETVDLFSGTFGSIPIQPREIVDSAMKRRAAAMIFVHNHTAGDPTPSPSDKRLTRELVFIGSVLDIKVLDHIVIGDNKYFSFADEGLIQKYLDDSLDMRIKSTFDTGVPNHSSRPVSTKRLVSKRK